VGREEKKNAEEKSRTATWAASGAFRLLYLGGSASLQGRGYSKTAPGRRIHDGKKTSIKKRGVLQKEKGRRRRDRSINS